MPFFLRKMLFVRILRLLLRLLASLASAVVLVSGYLFFLSLSSRAREDEGLDEVPDEETEEEDDSSTNQN